MNTALRLIRSTGLSVKSNKRILLETQAATRKTLHTSKAKQIPKNQSDKHKEQQEHQEKLKTAVTFLAATGALLATTTLTIKIRIPAPPKEEDQGEQNQ